MNCELCGQKPAVYDCEIEGTLMKVCNECSKFGVTKKKEKVKILVKEENIEEKESTYLFVEGYGSIVKKAREKLGLKQEEMAKRLNERVSLLHQIESEHLKPSIDLAKKLEKELKIKIIEEVKEDNMSYEIPVKRKNVSTSSSSGLTLGDFINYKKK
ncbi:MAG: transcriptional regulator [Candidatus Woesearchaeota archaeon]|nr:MAG: transcriptional regulator [Candidatus Woesearchaeota archaeon]